MRIGIMTFWWSQDNYGQLLQCCALQKYLRDLGHDTFVIRYKYELRADSRQPMLRRFAEYLRQPGLIFNAMRRILGRKLAKPYQGDIRARQFDRFRAEKLTFSEKQYASYIDLVADPPKADFYIVGSDQVWNTMPFSEGDIRAYFLDWVPSSARRLSYAASIGTNELERRAEAIIRDALSRFDAVSCREKTGCDLLARNGFAAQLVCDPVMLTGREELLSHASGRFAGRDFMFVYLLNNECVFSMKRVRTFAAQHRLEIVYCLSNTSTPIFFHDDGVPREELSVPDWISAIRHARCVITNSFHCTLSGFLLGKSVGIIPLAGKAKAQNARMEMLLKLFTANAIDVRENSWDVLLTGEETVVSEAGVRLCAQSESFLKGGLA